MYRPRATGSANGSGPQLSPKTREEGRRTMKAKRERPPTAFGHAAEAATGEGPVGAPVPQIAPKCGAIAGLKSPKNDPAIDRMPDLTARRHEDHPVPPP